MNKSYKQFSCFLCETDLSKDLLITKLDFGSTSNSLLNILQPIFANEALGKNRSDGTDGFIISSSPSHSIVVLNKLKKAKYCNSCSEMAISAKDLFRQVELLQSEIIHLRKTIFGYLIDSYLKYDAATEEEYVSSRIAEEQSARGYILKVCFSRNRKFKTA